jgi:hypothetical protein
VLNDRLTLRRLKNMRRVPTSIPGVGTENEAVGWMDEEPRVWGGKHPQTVLPAKMSRIHSSLGRQ